MTAIEWTDETWNPVTGCDRVSPGCKYCYALELAPRLRAMGNPKYQRVRDGQPPTSGPAFGVTLHPDALEQPLRWRKPRRVFVNSMSDLFHEEVPDEFIGQIFAVMACASQHTFQVLTKRPERARDLLGAMAAACSNDERVSEFMAGFGTRTFSTTWPLPNVWLGTSIEMRTYIGRAADLRDTPAAVRFISAEPLLGPLTRAQLRRCERKRVGDGQQCVRPADHPGDCTTSWGSRTYNPGEWPPDLDLTGIDWLIVGGESSGSKSRQLVAENIVGQLRPKPAALSWVRDLRDACQTSGTAFFFKQWGGRTSKAGGRELDGRTWDEFPPSQAVAA